MTNKKVHEKLTHLKKYDLDDELKINLIENMYKLAHLNFKHYKTKLGK